MKRITITSDRTWKFFFWASTFLVVMNLSAMERSEKDVNLFIGTPLRVILLEPDPEIPKQGICILLPPGAGNEKMVRIAEKTLGNEFVKRGWRVVIPVSPDGDSFFGPNTYWVVELIHKFTDETILLAGISNGGISALEVAALVPDKLNGVLVTPGLLRTSRINTERLRGVPVFLRLGENDEQDWAQAYPTTIKKLEDSGVVLDAKLLPDTRHAFTPDWKEVDAWLEELKTSRN
jgi:pimeloyl-ACP methyl ester carboxylesterase